MEVTKEIKLNDSSKSRLANLIKEKHLIDRKINECINIIVEANGLDSQNATYELSKDLSKIKIVETTK